MSTRVTYDLERLRKVAEIRLECLPEDVPIEGNAMASGDDNLDREVEERIRADLENGNPWVWCCAKVTVSYRGLSATEYIGGCSYESEEDFKAGGYYEDMVEAALTDLWERFRDAAHSAKVLGISE